MEQTSTSQSVVASRQYDAFGNEVSSQGPWQGPFQYGGAFGYHTDSDYGLKHLGARYYDSTTGRFLSRDPIKDGRNWYVYCDGSPLAFADPTGLLPMSAAPGSVARSGARERPPGWFWDWGSNFFAGWGDTLTLSGTYWLRELVGANEVIDGSSAAYRAGVAVGVAHGVAIGGAGRAAGWRVKVGIHGPHHTFGRLGKLPHMQVNVWRIGHKGSGRAVRIPLPKLSKLPKLHKRGSAAVPVPSHWDDSVHGGPTFEPLAGGGG